MTVISTLRFVDTMDSLVQLLERHGTVTTSMKYLRKFSDAQRLGCNKRDQLSRRLIGNGICHYPKILPNNQYDPVRLCLRRKHADRNKSDVSSSKSRTPTLIRTTMVGSTPHGDARSRGAIIEYLSIAAKQVMVTEDTLTVELSDGRSIAVPLAWYPRLFHGSVSERQDWRLIGLGRGIHWPKLDEDISVENLLLGQRSAESQASLRGWLARRAGVGGAENAGRE